MAKQTAESLLQREDGERNLILAECGAAARVDGLDTRIVYGNSSFVGRTGTMARSASAPWPISRRPAPRIMRTSPTEYGGKL